MNFCEHELCKENIPYTGGALASGDVTSLAPDFWFHRGTDVSLPPHAASCKVDLVLVPLLEHLNVVFQKKCTMCCRIRWLRLSSNLVGADPWEDLQANLLLQQQVLCVR